MNATLDGLADGDEVSVEYSKPAADAYADAETAAAAARPDHQDLLGRKLRCRSTTPTWSCSGRQRLHPKVADSFYFQCTTRTVQESKLFPVNPYIALSYYNAWYRYPELLRKIDAAMPAEEIGDRARSVGSYVNTITIGRGPAVLPRRPPVADRHGDAEADRRGRRRARRARLHAAAEPRLPPRARRTCCPATAATKTRSTPRARRRSSKADALGRHARRQAAHGLHPVHGRGLGLRLPQPLRVPAELLQPRPVQDQGRQRDAGPRRWSTSPSATTPGWTGWRPRSSTTT